MRLQVSLLLACLILGVLSKEEPTMRKKSVKVDPNLELGLEEEMRFFFDEEDGDEMEPFTYGGEDPDWSEYDEL